MYVCLLLGRVTAMLSCSFTCPNHLILHPFPCPPVDERLRKECKLLQALGALCCRACGRVLARSADAVQVRPQCERSWKEPWAPAGVNVSTAHVPVPSVQPTTSTLLPLLLQMSEEGISACYVNSHSFVHDIVTLSQVRGGGCG